MVNNNIVLISLDDNRIALVTLMIWPFRDNALLPLITI